VASSSWLSGTFSSGVGNLNDEDYNRDSSCNPPCEETETWIGSGPPVIYDPNGYGPLSYGELGLVLDRCVYSVRGIFSVNADNGTGQWPAPIGEIAIDDIPIGQNITLSGNATLPVRSSSPEHIPFYAPGGFGGLVLLILGDGNAGTAQVSWSFTPQGVPTPGVPRAPSK
jgi:hypothetical protein